MIQPENKEAVADVEAMAADWLASLDRSGKLSADSEAENLAEAEPAFGQWLNADFSHRIAFLQMLSAWQRTERMAALQTEDDAVSRPRRSSRPNRAMLAGVGAALAAGLCAGVLTPLMGWFPGYQTQEPRIYYSQLGETRTVALEDGTQVTLNTNSRIDVDFTKGTRHVKLVRGEAVFDVARDENRPFEIDTPSGDIQVLGTVFAAELREQSLEVAVLEGVVTLAPETGMADQVQKMTAGMIGHANDRDVMTEAVGLEEVEDRLLWRTGRIRFKNMPLSEVAAEFNRYSRYRLVIEDESAADLRIGGTFAVDNVEGFVRLAESGLGLKVRRAGQRIEIAAK